MKAESLFPRRIISRVISVLTDTPVVLIHGPRQSGKTTLARMIGEERDYSYFTFDDASVLSAASEDPLGFIHRLPERSILDEVQKTPELLSAIKLSVDRDRLPGRFLLTGSANVLLVPKLSDSLAGRMEIIPLFPLAQCEIEGSKPFFLKNLFSGGDIANGRYEYLGEELIERILKGGYPEPLMRTSWSRRSDWYRNYVDTLIQRDIRDLARLRSLDAIPALLEVAASQSAGLINFSELASPFHLSRPTIRHYINLLENIFLVDLLKPWHSNRLKRLIKTAKIHLGDTGLAGALLHVGPEGLMTDRKILGRLLETFVFNELRKQASWTDGDITFFHYRDKDQYEVDIVMQQGMRFTAVEIKAAETVKEKDFRGIRRLQRVLGKQFAGGVVLYTGENALPFGERLSAVPISALWKG